MRDTGCRETQALLGHTFSSLLLCAVLILNLQTRVRFPVALPTLFQLLTTFPDTVASGDCGHFCGQLLHSFHRRCR
jgi:hypothetical protein